MARRSDTTSHVPVRGRKRKLNQQGTTLVSRARHTEIAALRGVSLDALPFETLEQHQVKIVWAADAAIERLPRHLRLHGEARWLVISKRTGVPYSEVKHILKR